MDEALAILLLPGQLEGLALEAHARDLLSIPRVIALEPGRVRTPRFMRDPAAVRQATRMRLPGSLRVVVLYHPAQYPLARALCAAHEQAELWYVVPEAGALAPAVDPELLGFDELARDRAAGTLAVSDATQLDDQPLRLRLRELEVISPRAFVPDARFGRARRPGSRPGRRG